ncbi:MAG: anion permease [Nitrospirae bacterium CG_4_10_14_0_8_um_filter_41_23]|nr:MAG: anion permease [Nitrospirae bacterium CG2_30_41_42]PIQ93503.1 MAG: anion permease [Nitrospirae bacterium CG11_big_fil_rev_8_21_14_0_20_41_14]PIV43443.1 MAG: anion permease [Nitrospirae bacterium CG02_land_8_20_14_3_00_41_53]PIW87919.1 MAG: anion permease [Nitrospirae bacterium CG_4_8_14_3_um_filter_41_47]PIY87069.1 MAG: anion permease [Nitrospirae bacterium CG_4_10_14_0_8_um_filter_41_23]PJA79075.1 MAG: anion permease [Nitrospirae bacterium CG_4_9_14_3_um_filter_41_27]
MHDTYFLLLCVIVLSIIFDFINGFHDTANAIATSVSTRVLSPKAAVSMAAILNTVGALSGTAVAKTVGAGLVQASCITQVTIVSALIAAIMWDIITWYLGLPTSSSHAILSGVVGAGIATAGMNVVIQKGVYKVLMGLIFSPLIGFILGFFLMLFLVWLFRRSAPSLVGNLFGRLQILSAAYMAFSHGSNDAQKTMGIITIALVSYYKLPEFHVPLWVILVCATAMALGTAAGGWRIIKTLGMRLVHLKPIHGFAAETSAATVIEIASRIGLPLSTTHVISSTIMGVGASKRLSAVKWGIGGNIILVWILTLPACSLLAWVICKVLNLIVR